MTINPQATLLQPRAKHTIFLCVCAVLLGGILFTIVFQQDTVSPPQETVPSPLAPVEKKQLILQPVEHERLFSDGIFYLRKDGTLVDLMQRDAQGNELVVVPGVEGELIDGKSVRQENGTYAETYGDRVMLATSTDGTYALYSRSRGDDTQVFMIDRTEDVVFRFQDEDVPLIESAFGEGFGWLDHRFIYLHHWYRDYNNPDREQAGGATLINLDFKNKTLIALDKSALDPKASPFQREWWDATICDTQIIYARSWHLFKQSGVDNPDKKSYLVSTDPDGRNRKILETSDYLSGIREAVCM